MQRHAEGLHWCLTELVSPELCVAGIGAFPAGIKPPQGFGLAGSTEALKQSTNFGSTPHSKLSAGSEAHLHRSPSSRPAWICLSPSPLGAALQPTFHLSQILGDPTAASLLSPLPFQAIPFPVDIASQPVFRRGTPKEWGSVNKRVMCIGLVKHKSFIHSFIHYSLIHSCNYK